LDEEKKYRYPPCNKVPLPLNGRVVCGSDVSRCRDAAKRRQARTAGKPAIVWHKE
jgi:hypothetical protein